VSVYCDPIAPCLPNANWRWHEASHLFADDLDELHAFARLLGLKRAWFQNKPGSLPHYDLTRSKWEQAQRIGVVLLTERAVIVAKWREIKAKLAAPPAQSVFDL
jgi:hypothetical protein